MRLKFVTLFLALLLIIFCNINFASAHEAELTGLDYPLPAEPKELSFPTYFCGITDGLDTATTSKPTFESTACLKVVPNPESKKGYINLDGYNYQGVGIDVAKHSTIVIVYKYVSDEPVSAIPQLRLMGSGIFTKYTFMPAREKLVANRWAVASFDLTLARPTIKPGGNTIAKQFHFLPFGETDVKDLSAKDAFYISKMYIFADESESADYRKHYIDGMYDYEGYNIFKPGALLKRADACTMIARLYADGDVNVPASDGKSAYSDVTGNAARYIEFLEDKGFLKSYTDEEFLPDKYITKAEFAELVHYLEIYLKNGEDGFVSDFAQKENPASVFPGDSDALNRGEAVYLINLMLGRNPGLPFKQYQEKFKDVKKDSFLYNHILDAALDHITFTGKNGEEFWARGISNASAAEDYKYDTAGGKIEYDKAIANMNERIQEIRETKTPDFDIKGQTYYVSTHGSDPNDGLSEYTPFQTAKKANEVAKNGDLVLFERGHEWRERWTTVQGVTYSAYGTGPKPIFNGNLYGNLADDKYWTLVDGTTYVYKLNLKVKDIGNIVLTKNGTVSTVTKSTPTLSGSNHLLNNKVFDPATSMTSNNTFICIYDKVSGGGVSLDETDTTLYFRCYYGNPGEYYDSIEICERASLVRVLHNCHLDNIELKYTGSHGFAMGTANNVKFTNCELSYIGGAAQYYSNGSMVRFGNGIEVYGSCDGFTIDNCYIYQCYDAGITHQYSQGGDDKVIHKNVYYTNNVIDKCIYNIEYFMGYANNKNTDRYMENILYKGNIIARNGRGWGYSPSRSGGIVGWGHHPNRAKNFVIEENVFITEYYRAFFLGAETEADLPDFKNNTYFCKSNRDFITYGLMSKTVTYKSTGRTLELLENVIEDENSTLYYY